MEEFVKKSLEGNYTNKKIKDIIENNYTNKEIKDIIESNYEYIVRLILSMKEAKKILNCYGLKFYKVSFNEKFIKCFKGFFDYAKKNNINVKISDISFDDSDVIKRICENWSVELRSIENYDDFYFYRYCLEDIGKLYSSIICDFRNKKVLKK